MADDDLGAIGQERGDYRVHSPVGANVTLLARGGYRLVDEMFGVGDVDLECAGHERVAVGEVIGRRSQR